MIRFCFFALAVLVLLAGCSDVLENPLNQPPEILSIQAPGYISANDTIFVRTYDNENDTLSLQAVVFTAGGNSVGSAFSKAFTDDGLAGDKIAHDNIFTGIINRSALLAQATSQFEFVFTVSERGKNTGASETIIISQNPDNGHPPVIINLTAPDTVNTSFVSEFIITVTVSDPEGLTDIRSVTMKSPSNNFFNLYDDGINADDTAGDGIYSGGFSVSPATAEGSYLFTFHATDRLGLKSDSIQKTIVIVH
jgi:hypothetical protein